MPPIFNNLLEARAYLLVVMRRSYHFLATTGHSSQATFLVRNFEMLSPDRVIVTTGTNIYSTSYNVPCAMHAEQMEFAEDIFQWSHAFQSLYLQTRRPEVVGFKNFVGGTLLRIHAIATTIVVGGVLFTEETSYDAFLPQSQELFNLTTIIIDAYRKKSEQIAAEARFFLDLGITSPLYLLVTRCRDHSLRVRAIELLKGWHIEACWQPRLIAGIGEFLMDVEENGNTTTIILEKSRAVITAVYDKPEGLDKNEALVQCV